MSEGAVARLEAGEGAEDWSLRQLRSLAAALAVDVADLLREAATAWEGRRDDVETIGALLGRFSRLVPTSTLAHATGWELARVNSAVRALDVGARPTGQRVQRLRGGVALRPTRSVADDERLERLLRREIAPTKLSRSQLDMLEAVGDGTSTNSTSARPTD